MRKPPVPISAQKRRTISIAVMAIIRHADGFFFHTNSLTKNIDEIIVMASISIGQYDGRLMTVSDISNYTGLPRASVIRKLRRIGAIRKVLTVRDGQRVCYYFPDINDTAVLASFAERIEIVRKLCTAVSKLDTV